MTAITTITQDVVIPPDHKLTIDIPPDCPPGNARITLTVEPDPPVGGPVNRAWELCGKGKGKVWMSDDFDAPLEDFAEYMG